jgi:LysR family transcriptional regulator for metE and metH
MVDVAAIAYHGDSHHPRATVMRRERAHCAVEVRHLRLIAAIAEHGSMTSAGRVLDLSQPALSHQLRDLEARLRSPLFVRTARRMVLTPAGEQLAQIARAVLAQIDAFERQVLDGDFAVPRGTIRIATQCHTAYHWLPAVLRAFRDRWPSVELRVAPEHTQSPIAALCEGSLDLALVYTNVSDRRVRLEPLFDDELVVITSPDHRLAEREYVAPEALADEHLFVYSLGSRRSVVLNDILEPAGVPPKQITRLQLTEAIIELVAAGMGVALLARWAVAPAVRSGAVRALRLGRRGCPRTWYAATRNADVTPAYRFDLIELLRRHLGAGPVVRAQPRLRSS